MISEDEYEEDDIEDEVFEPYQAPSRRAEYEAWDNTEHTTMMWQLIDRADLASIKSMISADPDLVYLRSEDGRGPLFWAYEYEAFDIVQFLLDAGADPEAVDANGNTPVSLMGKDERPAAEAAEEEEEEDEYE